MFTTNVGEFILPVHLVITVLGVDDNAVIPSVFSVSENYPNPFNPRTQFTVSLPKMSHVVVTIYDILGRQVALLAEGDYNAGRYRMEWDGMMDMNAAAPSGVYLLVVQAGDHVFKHKMIMMK
jgi:flagellar hook assembly protein FlgD